MPLDRLADEGLGQMIAVAFGGVDQVHAKLPGPPEQRVDLLLGEASPCWVKLRPHSPPSCQVPIPTTDTRSPVRPSRRYFIIITSIGGRPYQWLLRPGLQELAEVVPGLVAEQLPGLVHPPDAPASQQLIKVQTPVPDQLGAARPVALQYPGRIVPEAPRRIVRQGQ